MPTAGQPTKAIGYIRVSTDKQAEHGVSLDAQMARLTAYAQLYDLDLIDVIVEAESAKTTSKRPGLQRALAMLKKGQASALLVTKLDRLVRSVKDLGTLVEEYFSSDKITLLSVQDSIDTRTAAGRLVLNVLGSVAQWERETIAERTTEALHHLKAEGKRTGEIPYGYELAADGKALLPHEGEQAVIATIRQYRSAGLSLRRIVTMLARAGITTRKGTALSLTQVCRILKAS